MNRAKKVIYGLLEQGCKADPKLEEHTNHGLLLITYYLCAAEFMERNKEARLTRGLVKEARELREEYSFAVESAPVQCNRMPHYEQITALGDFLTTRIANDPDGRRALTRRLVEGN